MIPTKASVIVIIALLVSITGILSKILLHQQQLEAERQRRKRIDRAADAAGLLNVTTQFSTLLESSFEEPETTEEKEQEPDQKR